MSKSDSLIRNTAILTIGTLFTKVLSFIVIPLFSKWLSVEDYGTFDLYSTYIMLLIPVLTLSCGEAVFRFLIDTKNDDERNRIVSSGTGIIVIGILIGVIGVSIFLQESRLIKISLIIYLTMEIINNYLLSYVRGEKTLMIYAQASILTMVGYAVFVTLTVYFWKMGLTGILFGYGAAYGLSNLFIVVRSGFLSRLRIDKVKKSTIQELLRYSTSLIPNTISWWIMNVSDRTILNWVLGAATQGVYSIACKIPSLCSTLFGVFQLSWQQSVSETINDDDKEVFYNQVLNNLICTISSICIGVLSVNFIMFDYIFDPKYANAYWHSGLLIPATAMSSVAAYLGGIFIGQKDTKSNGSTTMMTAVINVAVHLALIRFIGVYAASVSTVAGYAVLIAVRWLKISRTIKLRINKKTGIVLLLFAYYIGIQYYRCNVLEIVNIVAAVVIFAAVNRAFILKMLRGIAAKIKH